MADRPYRCRLRVLLAGAALLTGCGGLLLPAAPAKTGAAAAFAGQRVPEAKAPRPQLTLAALWQQTQAQLSRGQSTAALESLQAMAAQFGQEPQYRDALPRLLPLQARLLLSLGNSAEAAECYRQWLVLPQTQGLAAERSAVLGILAGIYEQSGDLGAAQSVLAELLSSSPNQAQRQFARLQLATLQARQVADAGTARAVGSKAATAASPANPATNGGTDAVAPLRQLATEPDYPPALRAQARLLAISFYRQSRQTGQAAQLLLEQPWEPLPMPQLAQQSFTALQTGIDLLQAGQPQAALDAFAYVAPGHELLELQQQQRGALAATLAQQQRRSAEGSLSAAAAERFLAAQLTQADALLERLPASESLSTALLLARAEAFLQTNRPWEAASVLQVLCHSLAAAGQQEQQTAGADSVQAQVQLQAQAQTQDGNDTLARARYRYLIALRQAGREESLQAAATAFASEHAAHPLTPQANYLLAESLRRQKRYTAAITLIDTLLAQQPAPAPADAALLHFERGYSRAFLGQYTQAQADFAQAADLAGTASGAGGVTANALLRGWAQYWQAQTHLLAADYPQAEAAFATALQTIGTDHPARPYARFSCAQASYGAGLLPAAQTELEAFLQQEPDHRQAPQARLLLTEVLIANGDTDAALDLLQALAAAQTEPWHSLARLRQGGVYEELGQWQQAAATYTSLMATLAEHLQQPTADDQTGGEVAGKTAANTAATAGSRYAESAFYAARALQHLGENRQLAALVTQAVQAQGDNPAAGDFEKLLSLAHRHRIDPTALFAAEHSKGSGAQQRKKTKQSPAAESYEQWLQRGAAGARRSNQPTLAARFEFALSQQYRRRGQSDLEQAMLLQIAHHTPPALQDTRTLEQVCQLLSEKDFASAAESLAELSARYRAANPRPAAIQWAQAQQALHLGNTAEAMEQLSRLGADWPSHPLLPQALHLQADIYTEAGRSEEAAERLLSLLQLPASTPAQRTAALLALARRHAASGQPAEAIAYYQRLYTLYRADPQALQAAYLESAELFKSLGQSDAARATYAELLSSLGPRLSPEQRERIETLLQQSEQPQAGEPSLPATQPVSVFFPPTAVATATMPAGSAEPAERAVAAESTRQAAQEPQPQPQSLPQPKRPSLPKEMPEPARLAAHTEISPAAQQYENPWQAQPTRAARVFLIHGAQLEGDIIGTQDGQLHLRLRQAGNRIGETAVPLERIAQIDFGDAALWQQTDAWQAAGEPDRAYAGRTRLYLTREHALAFSSDTEMLTRFAALAAEALDRGDLLLAARIASRCAERLHRSGATSAAATSGSPPTALAVHFNDTELLALWQMGLRDQAAELAQTQLAQRAELPQSGIFPPNAQTPRRQPQQQHWKHPASALPYAVLAAQALSAGLAEDALELALQPIVFARQGGARQTPHLAAAYAQAIAAATARGDDAYAQALRQEAQAHSADTATHALQDRAGRLPE